MSTPTHSDWPLGDIPLSTLHAELAHHNALADIQKKYSLAPQSHYTEDKASRDTLQQRLDSAAINDISWKYLQPKGSKDTASELFPLHQSASASRLKYQNDTTAIQDALQMIDKLRHDMEDFSKKHDLANFKVNRGSLGGSKSSWFMGLDEIKKQRDKIDSSIRQRAVRPKDILVSEVVDPGLKTSRSGGGLKNSRGPSSPGYFVLTPEQIQAELARREGEREARMRTEYFQREIIERKVRENSYWRSPLRELKNIYQYDIKEIEKEGARRAKSREKYALQRVMVKWMKGGMERDQEEDSEDIIKPKRPKSGRLSERAPQTIIEKSEVSQSEAKPSPTRTSPSHKRNISKDSLLDRSSQKLLDKSDKGNNQPSNKFTLMGLSRTLRSKDEHSVALSYSKESADHNVRPLSSRHNALPSELISIVDEMPDHVSYGSKETSLIRRFGGYGEMGKETSIFTKKSN